ncbi:hypothetical protein BKA69DRAFT_1067522 [Paraphysoderma sedebokerense]|nr:hypothetical protein BKA69DRAFT_1067522 [Paraphysoderma sedebokerense]
MDTLVKIPLILTLVLCLVRSALAQNATSNISVPCFELSASQYCKGWFLFTRLDRIKKRN